MMLKIASVYSAFLLFLFAPGLSAQDEAQVVEVRGLVSRDTVAPGEMIRAAVFVKVQAGYHINDNAPLDEFMIPTSLVVDENPDFEVVEVLFPKGRRARFAYSESELVVYDGEVVLGVLLKAKEGAAPGPKALKASVGYQACNNESCLPPKEIGLEIPVTVAAAGGPDIHPEVFDKLRFRALQKK